MSRNRCIGLLLMAAVCSSALAAGTQTATLARFTYTEYHMGVDTRLVVYAPDLTTAESACAAAFERIAELDTIMSDYRVNSELMQVCARAGRGPIKVSPDLFKVLRKSQEVSERSEGLFDVTVGPLVQLWRKARKTGVLPKPAALERARKLVGWQMLLLDVRGQTVRLLHRGMRLDLGAIGKGYADDEAGKVFKRFGLTSFMVEMGGDIVVGDPPPETDGWTISVPNAEGEADMKFANCAVSTSGDTEEFVVIGGSRYSHVINPLTGQALTNRVQSTVVAREGLTSDPVGTALTLLDAAGRSKLLSVYPGVKAYIRRLDP